ncbi:SpoIIE family protein phosphatase [Nonomuraea africana]|uniref:Serine phosphatase RsbU (Regulator of sigma subunit) n=1 Tax=Nonomuraea africana TaxID=46171 RepID=A0ABR9KII3_9ACTN|nr:SpoIIE family protein phosphatase [Nonomuraea africana]MBE1561794.1 serine phosphatase RsbU (regulator of sigma subunit) [Nonomuraea africana]
MQPPSEPDGERAGIGRLAATIERLRRQVQEAQQAADGRALIELARGILIERLRCGPTQAARQLAALAEEAGVSPLELAADLINQAARDRLAEVAEDVLADAVPAETRSPAVRLRAAEHGMVHAPDTQAVAVSLLEHALGPLGAAAVAVWVAGPDASLRLAGYAGFSAEEARRWHYVPPGVTTAARRALTERRTVWFDSLRQAGPPTIGHRQLSGGRVTVPAGTGGRVLGVLEIGWPDDLEPQSPQIRRQVEALAELVAHTIEAPSGQQGAAAGDGYAELVDLADGLHDPALVLTPHLDGEGHLVDFRVSHANGPFLDPAGRPRGEVVGALLLETYPLLAGDGGIYEKVQHVYATGEPFRADRMALTTLVDQVPLSVVMRLSLSRQGGGVLVVWAILDETSRLARLLQHAQRLGRIGGFEEDAVLGEITWNQQLFEFYGLERSAAPIPIDRLAEHAHPDDVPEVGRFLRTLLHHRRSASVSFRLRRSDGISRHIRVVAEPVFDDHATLLAIRGVYQDISAQHWTEVALAATQDQLVQSEQQAAERNRLALQLQHAIMPPSRGPMDAFDLQIAVRYRPAEKEHLVGGDWYDAIVLPSKQILLSVGDVAGHGIEAATGMVVLRNALRGLAVTGAGPAQLMTWLNLVAHQMIDNFTATAICALYNPGTRVLRWARAGHLPPILIRDDRAAELPMIGGILLGAVSEADFEEGRIELRREDTLLMYTDGLIERTDRTLEDSQRQLLVSASRHAATLDARLDHLLAHNRSDTDDDTCLIGIGLR